MLNNTTQICYKCGGELKLLNQATSKVGNSLSLVTVANYQCKNATCQNEINQKSEEGRKHHEEQLAKIAARSKAPKVA